jgi:hypothetical protein
MARGVGWFGAIDGFFERRARRYTGKIGFHGEASMSQEDRHNIHPVANAARRPGYKLDDLRPRWRAHHPEEWYQR